MPALRRKLAPPPGVRVIVVNPNPPEPARAVAAQLEHDISDGWSEEFERKYARQIYRGIEQLGLL